MNFNMPILDDFYYFIGFGITAIILIVLLLELLVRFLEKIKTVFIGKQLRRQDFLHKDYHVYINWTDNWDKPIFKYIPVGLRYFNDKNCISPVWINKQGMRAIELDEIRPSAYTVILIGG